jgi:dTDP-D-glucose 4,6-dehydratase
MGIIFAKNNKYLYRKAYFSLEEGLRKTYKWYMSNEPNLVDIKMNRIQEMVKC